MKKTLVALSSFVFIFFVGCGGDSSKAATPPTVSLNGATPTADDQATQAAIANWAQQSDQLCGAQSCQVAQAGGPVILANIQAGQPQANTSASLCQNPAVQSAIGSNATNTPGTCQYALGQLKLNMDSAAGGTYTSQPAVQQWFETAVLRPIGSAGANCLPQAYQVPGFVQAASQLGQCYAGTLSGQIPNSSSYSSTILSGISQATVGLTSATDPNTLTALSSLGGIGGIANLTQGSNGITSSISSLPTAATVIQELPGYTAAH